MAKNNLVFEIPPHVNSGESVMIITEFGDGYITQKIEIESYVNSVTVNLFRNVLTPEVLRDLANKIEERF